MTPERYKELADAAVRLGVGHTFDPLYNGDKFYCPYSEQKVRGIKWPCRKCLENGTNAKNFITDWRVVGALMEMVAAAGNLEILVCAIEGSDNEVAITELTPTDNPLERESLIANEAGECLKIAIAEACLKALGEIDHET
jgi:hypothetical protein